MVNKFSPLELLEGGLIAFAMGVNVFEDRLEDSTRPDVCMPLLVFVPMDWTCVGVLVVEERAVFADWVTCGCELEEAVLVMTALPTGIPLEIIVAAREVSNFIGSERCLSEEFIGKIGRFRGVTVTDELLLEDVLTIAVGFRRISGVQVFNGPPTLLTEVPGNSLIVEGEELALLTAAGGTVFLVFNALDFSGLLTFTNLSPSPSMNDGFSFTGGGGEESFDLLSFTKCVLFSLLLLCFFCPLSLCLSPN